MRLLTQRRIFSFPRIALALLVTGLFVRSEFGTAETFRPLELRDGLGRMVKIAQSPQRIASVSLASDEVLVELLSRSGQLNRLVAVSKLSDDARWSNISGRVPQTTARVVGEAESIVITKPDLVILAGFNRPEVLATLERAKIPTFVVGPFNSLADIVTAIATLGDIVGLPVEAGKLRVELLTTLERARGMIPQNVRSKPARGPTLVSWSGDGTVMGQDTTFDSIVRGVGGVNAVARAGLRGWPKLDPERLARLRPDFVVVPVAHAGDEPSRQAVVTQIKAAPGWKAMSAVQKDRFIFVPEAQLLALSHHVAPAVQTIADALAAGRTRQSSEAQAAKDSAAAKATAAKKSAEKKARADAAKSPGHMDPPRREGP